MKRKLTPKEKVLRKWPDAGWIPCCIYRSAKDTEDYVVLGRGIDAREAWANAARNLK